MEFIKEIRFEDETQAIKSVQRAVSEAKVVVLRGVAPSVALHSFYTRLSDHLGHVVGAGEDLQSGRSTGDRWISVEFDPAIRDRYRTANVHQPLHTDDSYVPNDNSLSFFYCKTQAPRGGATTFLDSADLVGLLELDAETELLHALQTIPVCFSKSGVQRTRPIVTRDELGWSMNFNYYCVDPLNPPEARAVAERLHHFLEHRVRNAGIPTAILLGPGEAVLFHDQRVLHGRNAYFASAKGDRSLVKGSVLLDPRSLRPVSHAAPAHLQ